MSKKIIQIATNQDPGAAAELFALCDDGTVWVLASPSSGRVPEQWHQIPSVPQGERAAAILPTR